MRSVGLDLGSRKISYCIIENGKVTGRGTVSHIEELVPILGPGTPPANIAFEACREAWFTVTRLTDWGQTPLVVDTTRVKQLGIGQHGRKNDRIDGECIAWAVERGHVPLAHVLSLPRQRLRTELLTRRALVESRTQFVTTIRGIARGHGLRLPDCGAELFVAKVRSIELPEQVRELVAPLLSVLVTVQQQICVLDERLEKLGTDDGDLRLLMTAPGVGLIVAAMFVSVIDEARRFRSGREVASYLGLVPREKSTGMQTQRLGAITKHGNSYARALLIQGAWYVLRRGDRSDPIVRWGRALAERRGNTVAAVAVARRLACTLWAMWKRRTAYDPAHVAEVSARGLEGNERSIASQAAALRREAKKTARRRQELQRRTVAAQRLSAAV
jgi:transposase